MAVNSRMSVNVGGQYIDLFPRTGMSGIIKANNALKYSEIEVTIPVVPNGQNTQNIAITTTQNQVNSPVYMVLLTEGKQAEKDYSTISQLSVLENELVITRLYSWPSNEIKVKLLFEERGVDK